MVVIVAVFYFFTLLAPPGSLRVPLHVVDIPACACNGVQNTLACELVRPNDLNVSSQTFVNSTITFQNRIYGAQVCFVVNTNGDRQVVEARIWAAGSYNSEMTSIFTMMGFVLWTVLGTGTALLYSMRCLHVGFAVALPGIALPILAGSLFRNVDITGLPAVLILVICFPATLASILGVTWTSERNKRMLFVKSRKIKCLLQQKDDEIKSKSSQVRTMYRKLLAAQETVVRVMAESDAVLRPFELSHTDLDFGEEEKTRLGEGSFGTVYRAVLRGTCNVAVKTMRVSKISEDELTKFKSELLASASKSKQARRII